MSAPAHSEPTWSVVIPTIGRPGLATLLRALDSGTGPTPDVVVVVDDRPRSATEPFDLPALDLTVRPVRCGGRGPAAARNVGWRHTSSEWVAFLDDDVTVASTWRDHLVRDLRGLPSSVGASQAVIDVPLPTDRRPTDDERRTAALSTARWITADMAYRRTALRTVDGFDERFPRAYREDSDLAVRVRRAGYEIVTGTRITTHPPAVSADPWASLRAQRGNEDNALMRLKYGRDWRSEIGEGPGMMPRHVVTTLTAAVAVRSVSRGRRRIAAAAASAWATLTAEFAARRIAAGPRSSRECVSMAVTSALIPPLAVAYRARGELRHRLVRSDASTGPARAVLFDRDDTIIVDVPYLADPDAVTPVDGAREALDLLRNNGIKVGVVSNQSGVARGLVAPEQLDAVNARVETLLGPFDTWQVCPHGEADGCGCRKPRPGMVDAAARELGLSPADCVLIGDIGADIGAAQAAGARAILVPTPRTRADEVDHARRHAAVAPTVAAAVSAVIAGAV
ncbi:HAD-IIIA family hydrolase [Rhodococcus sp. NBC_00297]|uniref:HAD-IIIA family hydrolase n=1 Tax=Rhodococcus sp. NBC_00297 TaxID=2976005 RepID=UPI002E2CFE52|nr:HAD-IIIA family hydrolase [Rhodococcus sp. NBC_00297]